jgi:outer membrane receptor protein involved in Fe transport
MSKKSKGILNLAYSTPWDKWKFDFTVQYNGKSRLPQLIENDQVVQEYSPGFFIVNAQVSKNFKNFELYLGGENLTDFVQDKLILGYENPFQNEFDASRVWGPVLGRRIYAGLRLTFK